MQLLQGFLVDNSGISAFSSQDMSEKRLKVLYILTKSNWGGAQRYVFDLATHMPLLQFDVAVGCGGTGALVVKLEAAGVRVIPLPSLDRDVRFFKEVRAFVSLISVFLRERPDIIHVNSSKAGGLGAVAAFFYTLLTRNFAPRVIFTVHGWAFREERPRWQRWLIRGFSWLGALFQDRVILISAADEADAKKFISKEKLHLIPHGIQPPQFLERGRARDFFSRAARTAIPNEFPLILTTAELTSNKGLADLIDAAKRLHASRETPLFHIVLIGEGEARKQLQKMIEQDGLSGLISLIGFLPEAATYLRGGDLFVLPSWKEGLPYAVLEAMSAGLAIVATNVGGVPDLIEDGVSGLLVPPKNPHALADAIAVLLRDPSRRRALGAHAARRVQERYILDRMIHDTVAVYRQGTQQN